ncbi:hypothetical protein ElyMa_005688000 [Elysia marginata]|uniref:Uncharacterized protein n=1 Tax=Elysia marginata TaxID=1093978 RepID=A0AAV4FGC2_9GAST|nr:hypothetical protein ElyMa_005688000 [Elysia marginata]
MTTSQTPCYLQNPKRLYRYDYEFQYSQGLNLLIEDTPSRAVGSDSSHRIPDLQINSISTIPDPIMTTILRNAVNDDRTLQIAQWYTIDNGP